MTMAAAAKINVHSGQADVRTRAGRAAMAVSWAAVTKAGAAGVGHRAPAIDGAAVTIASDNGTLTINGGSTGAAGVGETAAGRAAMIVATAAVMSLGGRRSHDGKTGGSCQESDDLFHRDWGRFDCFVF